MMFLPAPTLARKILASKGGFGPSFGWTFAGIPILNILRRYSPTVQFRTQGCRSKTWDSTVEVAVVVVTDSQGKGASMSEAALVPGPNGTAYWWKASIKIGRASC